MTFNTRKLETPVSFPKDKSEWHHFLEGRVDQALAVKRHIEDLPEYSLMFNAENIDGLGTSSQHRNHILKLCGAWKAPETFSNHANKWVNPNHPDAHRYSDAVVRCACGTPMLREAFSSEVQQPTNKQEHGECNKIERMKARVEFLENRREIARESYYYGSSMNGWHKRLGYEDKDKFGSRQAKEWGLDISELGRESRRRKARTFMVLGREYSAGTIGEVFGCSANTVQKSLKDETDTDPSILYSIRRAT